MKHLLDSKLKYSISFWINDFICRFFGHRYRLKIHITQYLREIKCTRCKQEFGMNDLTQSVLLLDDELIKRHQYLK